MKQTPPTTASGRARSRQAQKPGAPVGSAANDGGRGRSRRVLRLIALERFVRGLLLFAAGIYLLTHVTSDFGRLADQLMRALELDPRRRATWR